MRDRLNKDVPTMISAYEHGQNAADTANTFKPVRSTPAPRNGANGAMVSWLTAGDTSVTRGGRPANPLDSSRVVCSPTVNSTVEGHCLRPGDLGSAALHSLFAVFRAPLKRC